MASITKSDRDLLYSRALELTDRAAVLDSWADEMTKRAMPDLAKEHRNIATAMHKHAAECRRWADGYTGE